MKAAERQRTECATIVAQCKRPQGRAALGKATPHDFAPGGRNKKHCIYLPSWGTEPKDKTQVA